MFTWGVVPFFASTNILPWHGFAFLQRLNGTTQPSADGLLHFAQRPANDPLQKYAEEKLQRGRRDAIVM